MSELGSPGPLARLVTHPRAKFIIIGIWVVLFAGCGAFAGQLSKVQENDVSAWLPGDAESTRAIDATGKFFPPDQVPTVVIYHRDGGITAADKAAIAANAADFANVDNVLGVEQVAGQDSVLSQDGQAMTTTINIDPGTGGWETLLDVVKDIRDHSGALPDGLTMQVTGPGGTAADFMAAFTGGDMGVMIVALLVVIVALLFTYRSPVLWVLPVISAVFSLVVAMALVRGLVALDWLTVNGQTMFILPVLVFGAATDYALLLIARYREELRRHEDRHEAMAIALHRAGPAVVASGITVCIGLLCLMVATMTPTASLGPVCAIGVLVGVSAMVTLLPSLLLLSGRRVFWPVRPDFGSADHTEDSIWARVGNFVATRPRQVWIGTAAALIALAFGVMSLDATGLSNEASFRNTPESVEGQRMVAEHFDAGTGTPVYVFTTPAHLADVTQAMTAVDGVDPAIFPFPDETGTAPKVVDDSVMLIANLTAPGDSQEARDTVEDVRAAVHAVDGSSLVSGNSAQVLDMLNASSHDNKLVIPLVLLVVFLVLCFLLRALVAPLLLLGTVVLSFLAALGISSLLFTHVFGFDGADASYPLWCFVFLVALGIDYNIFLMTRVHEESKRRGTRAGALAGLRATGGVITAAGLVLAGTFLVLATLPMVFAAELGVTVALGVLLDTLIVRSVLVTALTLDIGRFMWWPSALFRKQDPTPETEEQPELQNV
jgi:putative drug exporter of the RND superfamily